MLWVKDAKFLGMGWVPKELDVKSLDGGSIWVQLSDELRFWVLLVDGGSDLLGGYRPE